MDNKNKNIRITSIVLPSRYFQITQGNTLAIPFTYSISVVSLQLKHSSGITVNSASLTNQTAYFNIDNIEPGFYRDCYLYDSTNNNMSYYFNLEIIEGGNSGSTTIEVTGLTISPTNKTLKVGETFTITPTITPSNATNKEVSWWCSDYDVAWNEGNVIYAAKEGTCVFYCQSVSNTSLSASCNIVVTNDDSSDDSSNDSSSDLTSTETALIQQYSSSHEATPNNPNPPSGAYNWVNGPRINPDGSFPVSTWNAVGHWMTTYKVSGASYYENVGLLLQNPKMWIWNTSTKSWDVLSSDFEWGTWYREDFWDDGSGNINNTTQWETGVSANHSTWVKIKQTSETSGRCFHPWGYQKNWRSNSNWSNGGQPYIVTKIDFKLVKWDENGVDNLSQARLVVNSGADWWSEVGATWQPDWSTNRDMAVGKFILATRDLKRAWCTNLPSSWSYGLPTDGTASDPTTIPVTSVTVSPSTLNVLVGDTYSLTHTISPSNATNKNVTWETTTSSVATVNKSGILTAKAAGTTTITCRSNSNTNVYGVCYVTVSNAATPPSNTAPTVSSILVTGETMNGAYTLTYTATDAQNDSLIHELSINNGSYTRIYPNNQGSTFTYNGSGLSVGNHVGRIRVSDGQLSTVSSAFTITIKQQATGVKAQLKAAKDNYDEKHISLKTTIRNIVEDGKFVAETEKNILDTAFAQYNVALSEFKKAAQKAIDAIGNKKAEDSVDEAKKYSDAQLKVVRDSITSRVESVENQQSTLDGEVTALQTWKKSAEEKITDSAIINTVKNEFYSKTDIDQKGYTTSSEVEQLASKYAFKFQEAGGYNYLLNSRWQYDMVHWNALGSNSTRMYDSKSDNYYIRSSVVSTKNLGFAQTIKVEKNKAYTASALVELENGVVVGVEFSWTNSLGQKCWSSKRSTVNYRNSVLWHTETFDISGEVQVFYFVDGTNSQSVNGIARWRWTQVEQGTTFSAWSQNSNEVYNGQTYIDKNGVRVNQSNIGSYTEMHAGGFFVKQNDGTKLFEASDAIRLYGYSGIKAFEVMVKENLNYGNAMINLCGGINFIHKPSQSVGINMITLGNDDRSDKYGFHNLSIRAHNSLGFADNYGYTNMYFATRTGRIIMKGALYQNTATPPSSFRLDTKESELYFGGYTKQDMVDSILKLDTATNVDADGDITMALLENDDDLTMTIIDEQAHVDVGSIVAGLVETVKMLKKEVDTLKNELSSIKTEF